MEKLTAPNLAALPGVRHGFFTRQGGVSQGIYASLNAGLSNGDDLDAVRENRRRIAEALGVPAENFLSAYQVHSTDVACVEAVWKPEDRPRVDALVTRQKNIAIALMTADCAPVLFADAEAGIVGAAHAGWRGAVGGILEKTIEAMEKLGAQRARIRAAIGPCIWQTHYEVGPEFPEPFLAQGEAARLFFAPAAKAEHFLFDLQGFVSWRLAQVGIADVAPSPADTYADEERFFSYRRNCVREGRATAPSLASAIFLAS